MDFWDPVQPHLVPVGDLSRSWFPDGVGRIERQQFFELGKSLVAKTPDSD